MIQARFWIKCFCSVGGWISLKFRDLGNLMMGMHDHLNEALNFLAKLPIFLQNALVIQL